MDVLYQLYNMTIWLYKDDDKLGVINHCFVFLLRWNGPYFKGVENGPLSMALQTLPKLPAFALKRYLRYFARKGHVPNPKWNLYTSICLENWLLSCISCAQTINIFHPSTFTKRHSQKVLKFCLLLLQIVFTLQSEVGLGNLACKSEIMEKNGIHPWKLRYPPKIDDWFIWNFLLKMVPFLGTFVHFRGRVDRISNFDALKSSHFPTFQVSPRCSWSSLCCRRSHSSYVK